MAKQLTRERVLSRKDAAVRFLDTVKHDPERASEVEDESLESYAEGRHFDIVDNPSRRRNREMTDTRTREDLLDEIADLQDANDSLQSQLAAISDILDQDQDGDDDDYNNGD